MRAQVVPFLFAPFLLLMAGCPVWGSSSPGPGPCVGLGCACDFDSDCSGDAVCSDFGVCERPDPECSSDFDCPSDEMCSFGECVAETPECDEDSDCVGGEVCTAGMCREPAGPTECRTHGDCQRGEYCDDNTSECVDSATCTDDAGCGDFLDFYCDFRATCVPDAPNACRSNADCDGSDQCIEGFCRGPETTCQFAYQCGAGRSCVNSACREVCGDDSTCASGTTCQSGFCLPEAECSSSSECGTGEHCVEARCLPDCEGGSSSCDPNEYCAEDDFCRPDWTESPFCSDDGDCADGSRCVDGACRTPCPTMTNAECAMTDPVLSICASDNLCYSSDETDPECEFQSECAGSQSCVNAICR